MVHDMKVLWFSNTSSNFPGTGAPSVLGGWISSLESAVQVLPDIDLAVAFLAKNPPSCTTGPVHYYPMVKSGSLFARIRRFFDFSGEDERTLASMQSVVDDFCPDIIHIFGTEGPFGLFCEKTSIPVVIHLQGLMGPYVNAWFPPGYSKWDLFRSKGFSPWKLLLQYRNWRYNCHAAAREKRILKFCRYFMGRTDWDQKFCSIFAPHARYFHCDEMLRSAFWTDETWVPPSRFVLMSTLSGPLYKGHDLILRTAKVLKESGLVDFEWNVFGVEELNTAERKTGIKSKSVNVFPKGLVPSETLKAALLSSSVYVHPSYIDNSPNSVCEAQVVGVPVVATAVGGVPSLFDSSNRDCLVPPNDPVAMAFQIRRMLRTTRVSDVCHYRQRHSPDSIVATLRSIYGSIFEGDNG